MGARLELRDLPLDISEHQARWDALCHDPALADAPYKIETDAYGLLLMSPAASPHSLMQGLVSKLLQSALGGIVMPELAIATPKGVKVPDVVWCSDEFMATDWRVPILLKAPPICVEVLSDANSRPEMREKIALYLTAGAQEVWLVSQAGEVEIHDAAGLRERSAFGVEVGTLAQ